MEYNSNKEELIIPEYGRHVQNMVRHARTIENPAQRQQFIEQVVKLMMQMHPQNRNLEDYRDKMWKHVFRIAEYDLEHVMPPNGERPTPEDRRKRPERVPYPVKGTKYRHYGHNVLTLIEKAKSMDKGPKRDGFVQVIGSYMKLAYKTWNREHYVSDDIIIDDLEILSNGELVLIEDASLDNLSRSNPKRHTPSNSTGHRQQRPSGGGRDSRNKGGGSPRGGGGGMRRQSGGGGSRGRRK
ncbi:MAG: DUF4290 domain-containing protein [Saprospiraceae bacterium]